MLADRRVRALVLAVTLAVGTLVACAPGPSLPPPATRPAASQPASQAAGFAPFTFIHAGDTELGSPDLPGTAQRFRQLADQANTAKVSLVIIAGDLVHDAFDRAQLSALDETLKVFRMPVRAVPGNHDSLVEFRKRFGPERWVYTLNNCDFIGVNSEDLSPAALAWLEEALKAAKLHGRTHTVVTLHHPPAEGSAVDRLFGAYRPSAVLCGHLHATGEAAHQGYVAYWVSGTAKVRDQGGFTYNVFRVERQRMGHEARSLTESAP